MNILITGKVGPNLDVIASCYAYTRLRILFNQEATCGYGGDMDRASQWIVKKLEPQGIVRLNPQHAFDICILVQASQLDELAIDVLRDQVIEVIDIRSLPPKLEQFPRAEVFSSPVSATSTMLTERYYARKLMVDRTSTIMMYCAIYLATRNLDPAHTTARDKAALKYLQLQTHIPNTVVRDFFVETQVLA